MLAHQQIRGHTVHHADPFDQAKHVPTVLAPDQPDPVRAILADDRLVIYSILLALPSLPDCAGSQQVVSARWRDVFLVTIIINVAKNCAGCYPEIDARRLELRGHKGKLWRDTHTDIVHAGERLLVCVCGLSSKSPARSTRLAEPMYASLSGANFNFITRVTRGLK